MYEHPPSDDIQLRMMMAYINNALFIPHYLIKKEHFILFYNSQCIGLFKNLSDNITSYNTAKNQPDITILEKHSKKIRLIIEVDGSSHASKEGRRKTAIRNNRYYKARLPYIIINKKNKYTSKEKWTDQVEIALKRFPDLS